MICEHAWVNGDNETMTQEAVELNKLGGKKTMSNVGWFVDLVAS
jgi:hypothetical protein